MLLKADKRPDYSYQKKYSFSDMNHISKFGTNKVWFIKAAEFTTSQGQFFIKLGQNAPTTKYTFRRPGFCTNLEKESDFTEFIAYLSQKEEEYSAFTRTEYECLTHKMKAVEIPGGSDRRRIILLPLPTEEQTRLNEGDTFKMVFDISDMLAKIASPKKIVVHLFGPNAEEMMRNRVFLDDRRKENDRPEIYSMQEQLSSWTDMRRAQAPANWRVVRRTEERAGNVRVS
ncbi:hypothetical protein LTR10_023070 [Elasticomyces elasticus]|nr:hypothetical protein LTR10_023070 [Elasticomyces elasticus]